MTNHAALTEPTLLVDIKERLDGVATSLAVSPDASDTVWTSALKNALGRLAREDKYGFDVCASGTEGAAYGEWLYDLCWIDTEEQIELGWITRRMPLAMECEWKSGLEIDADFDELVQSRADYRCMIFQFRHLDEFGDICARLATRVKAFRGSTPDDYYLLAGVDSLSLKFHYMALTGNGELAHL